MKYGAVRCGAVRHGADSARRGRGRGLLLGRWHGSDPAARPSSSDVRRRRPPLGYEERENATTGHGVRRARVIADRAADRENQGARRWERGEHPGRVYDEKRRTGPRRGSVARTRRADGCKQTLWPIAFLPPILAASSPATVLYVRRRRGSSSNTCSDQFDSRARCPAFLRGAESTIWQAT